MTIDARPRSTLGLPAYLLTLALLIQVPGAAPADESQGSEAAASVGDHPAPCATPGAKGFDFWLGEWEVTWDGGRGTNRIEKILGGCVLHEQFDSGGPGGNGLIGRSYSTWSPTLKKWRQTWVDNQGGYLDFVGGLEGERMILSRTARRDGETFLQRMVWHNIGADALDWNWERSDDGGKTWKPVWKIHYARR